MKVQYVLTTMTLMIASCTGISQAAFPLVDLDQSSITPTIPPPFFQMQGFGQITDPFTNQFSREAQSFTVGKSGSWYGFRMAGEGPHHPPFNNVIAPDHTIAWEIYNVDNSGSLTAPVSGQSGTFTIHNWDIGVIFDVNLNGAGIAVNPGDRYAISLEDQTTTLNFPNFGPVGSAVWYYGDWSSQSHYSAGRGFRFDPNTSTYDPININGPVDLLFETFVRPVPEPASAALGGLAFTFLLAVYRREHRKSCQHWSEVLRLLRGDQLHS